MTKMVIKGFAIWAAATIALRLAGQFVFRDASTAAALILLVITLPVMAAVAMVLIGRESSMERRAVAAIALVAPGMLLDPISAIWFARVFPNIRADAAGLFGGWLLFCNIVVLLTAVAWPTGSPRRSSSACISPAHPVPDRGQSPTL